MQLCSLLPIVVKTSNTYCVQNATFLLQLKRQ